jgi:hypothetical protein
MSRELLPEDIEIDIPAPRAPVRKAKPRAKRKAKTVLVTVTAADIKRGLRQHVDRCPVARACQRATGEKVMVTCNFGEGAVAVWAGDNHPPWMMALTPMSLATSRRVSVYDATGEMKPFSFRLRLP